MTFIKNTFLIWQAVAVSATACYSQDLRGGEIQFNRIGSLAYNAYIVIYQQVPSSIYRDYILISWGDASSPDTCSTLSTIMVSANVRRIIMFLQAIHIWDMGIIL